MEETLALAKFPQNRRQGSAGGHTKHLGVTLERKLPDTLGNPTESLVLKAPNPWDHEESHAYSLPVPTPTPAPTSMEPYLILKRSKNVGDPLLQRSLTGGDHLSCHS